jgi:hypothetical protein
MMPLLTAGPRWGAEGHQYAIAFSDFDDVLAYRWPYMGSWGGLNVSDDVIDYPMALHGALGSPKLRDGCMYPMMSSLTAGHVWDDGGPQTARGLFEYCASDHCANCHCASKYCMSELRVGDHYVHDRSVSDLRASDLHASDLCAIDLYVSDRCLTYICVIEFM